VHRKLHAKFAISGGIPNVLLSYGKPEEVRDFCLRVIREVARDGGYIMDSGAIMQDDTSTENLKVMTQVCREHGAYSASSDQSRGRGVSPVSIWEGGQPIKLETSATPVLRPCDGADVSELVGMSNRVRPRVRPGVCFPWEERVKELPEITGGKELVKRIWEDIDAFGNMYIWQLLLSF
jgi:hypothetical protein